MAEFTVNAQRHDPYKSSKFRVKWDGRYIAGIHDVSALARATAVVAHREGGDLSRERLAPGSTAFAPLVLMRGLTHDPAFEEWANKVAYVEAAPSEEMSLADLRKDVRVELCNEAGQLVMAWTVYRCWPSEYVAVDGFHAGENRVAVESLILQNEGWERDVAVVEPKEPVVKEE